MAGWQLSYNCAIAAGGGRSPFLGAWAPGSDLAKFGCLLCRKLQDIPSSWIEVSDLEIRYSKKVVIAHDVPRADGRGKEGLLATTPPHSKHVHGNREARTVRRTATGSFVVAVVIAAAELLVCTWDRASAAKTLFLVQP